VHLCRLPAAVRAKPSQQPQGLLAAAGQQEEPAMVGPCAAAVASGAAAGPVCMVESLMNFGAGTEFASCQS